MTTTDYLTRVMLHHSGGIATEHTYRGDLQRLIESIVPHIRATNEPKRLKERRGVMKMFCTLKGIIKALD